MDDGGWIVWVWLGFCGDAYTQRVSPYICTQGVVNATQVESDAPWVQKPKGSSRLSTSLDYSTRLACYGRGQGGGATGVRASRDFDAEKIRVP